MESKSEIEKITVAVVAMTAIIFGLFCRKMNVETGVFVWNGGIILSAGVIFLLAKKNPEYVAERIFTRFILLAFAACIAKLIVVEIIDRFSNLNMGFYSAWELCMIATTIPAMMLVFKH